MTRATDVLVWDRTDAPPPGESGVLLWRSYDESGGGASVPRRLEADAARVRARYLAFIHDLGLARVDGRTVADHLALEDGFSFWWMTLLAEKSPFKSPRLYSCLRLLALEDMLRERAPAAVVLASSDDALAEAAAALCARLGLRFSRRDGDGSGGRPEARLLFHALPVAAQGLLSLVRRVLLARPFRRRATPAWFDGERAIHFGSYFAHLDAASCARGAYRSRQWGPLPDLLHGQGRRTNWLHLFIHGARTPSPADAVSWLDRFNADAAAQGAHAFLDSYLTPGLAFRAVRRWLGLGAAARRLRGLADVLPAGGAFLWPLLRDDWRNSLRGPVSAANCLWVELFDAALAGAPPQKTGLYLCENQGWERAYLRAWRKHGHGRAIGVAHSTVPFWHLYYLDDVRTLASKERSAMPLPDLMAVNGPAAREILLEAGFPPERLTDVEALRYLDLPRPGGARRIDPEAAKVLVLGDIDPASMRSLLTCLSGAVRTLPPGWRFTLKPHPVCPVSPADYAGLEKVATTTEALDRILGGYDLAVAANGTSAAVDALQAGLPVVVGLDGADLNLSPLRGRPGARFAGTSAELAESLRAAARAPASDADAGFFFLERDLPRWRRLLS